MKFNAKELRNAFSSFMTGVTVVATKGHDDEPRGFTANSFTSVSLDPPLVLICIDHSAESLPVFLDATGFTVNILSEQQVDVSNLFATKRDDKFTQVAWHNSAQGYPLLADTCAWFECKMDRTIEAGDHVIIIGEVTSFDYQDVRGLGYGRGGYITLGLEQSAVAAASGQAGIKVGALLEVDGQLLLVEDEATKQLQPICTGTNQGAGSLSKLQALFQTYELDVTITSLYSVYENQRDATQSIYYRGTANILGALHPSLHLYDHKNVPWSNIASDAKRIMLKRYIEESTIRRYGVYFGDEHSGNVEKLGANSVTQ